MRMQRKKELDHAEDGVQGAEAQNVQADDKKEGVKAGTDLKALRKVCKNSAHVAACIMCKDLLQMLCRIIFTMIELLRNEHGNTAKNCRSSKGVRDFYLGVAQGQDSGCVGGYSTKIAQRREAAVHDVLC